LQLICSAILPGVAGGIGPEQENDKFGIGARSSIQERASRSAQLRIWFTNLFASNLLFFHCSGQLAATHPRRRLLQLSSCWFIARRLAAPCCGSCYQTSLSQSRCRFLPVSQESCESTTKNCSHRTRPRMPRPARQLAQRAPAGACGFASIAMSNPGRTSTSREAALVLMES
jgi:hypothetical protein